MTDQILPLFIAHELPVGIAGLIVAGIFAAAQSTISTSMNSTATTVVTDFMRPFKLVDSERGYLNAARALTLGFGIGGTALGLLFVDPDNRSLFGSFITVIGFFMGVLGGLFMLGMLTQRATARGAVYGALIGTSVVVSVWWFTDIAGYLYAAIGISVCFVVGYIASLFGPSRRSLDGLTIYTVLPKQESEAWVPTGSPN